MIFTLSDYYTLMNACAALEDAGRQEWATGLCAVASALFREADLQAAACEDGWGDDDIAAVMESGQ